MNQTQRAEQIELSTGKVCPKCGCESLEKCQPLNPASFAFDTHYHCVAGCGILFGIRKLSDGKIEIGYSGNEDVLRKRFKFIDKENVL